MLGLCTDYTGTMQGWMISEFKNITLIMTVKWKLLLYWVVYLQGFGCRVVIVLMENHMEKRICYVEFRVEG